MAMGHWHSPDCPKYRHSRSHAETDATNTVIQVGTAETDATNTVILAGTPETDAPNTGIPVGTPETNATNIAIPVGTPETDATSTVIPVGAIWQRIRGAVTTESHAKMATSLGDDLLPPIARPSYSLQPTAPCAETDDGTGKAVQCPPPHSP